VFAPGAACGITFADGMLICATARIAHIGLYREPETFVASSISSRRPHDLHERL